MSAVDERIVQMVFNNKQFENGVSTTLGTISKLKSSLNFDNQQKALTDLGKTANGLSFGALASAIEGAADGFSAFETIAVGALLEVGRKVEALGEKIVKELVFDQVSQGWEKFESETRNVSAIVNQSGKELETVEGYIDELNWYADVTSFNTSSMTSALSQFVSQGIELETAIPAIMGIGNSMTYAGASAQQASNGFQIYARAMAKGSMALHEWRQLQTLKVATAGLKQEFIDAAVAIGNLKEGEVTISSFEDSLQHGDTEGWLTTSVMLDVLSKKYGTFTNDLYDFQLGVSAETGEVLTLNEALEKYTGESDSFGKTVLESATLARTFSDAMDAAKDAASTAWSSIFKTIIGNSEEATEVWTTLNDVLVNTFAQPIINLAYTFKEWRSNGGRFAMLDAIADTYTGITNIIEDLGEVLDTVFPKLRGKDLADFTKKIADAASQFRDFTESSGFLGKDTSIEDIKKKLVGSMDDIGGNLEEAIQKSLEDIKFKNVESSLVGSMDYIGGNMEEAIVTRLADLEEKSGKLTKFQKIFEGIGAAADILKKAFEGLKKGFDNLAPGAERLEDILLDVGVKISDMIINVRDYLEEHKTFEKVFGSAGKFISDTVIHLTNLKDIFVRIKDALEPVVEKIGSFFAAFKDKEVKIIDDFSYVIERLAKGFESIISIFSKIGSKIGELIGKVFSSLTQTISAMNMEDVMTVINGGLLASFLSKLDGLTGGLSGLVSKFNATSISGIFESLKEGISGLFGSLGTVKPSLSETLMTTAKAILIMAAAVTLMSQANSEDEVGAAFVGMTESIIGLIAPIKILSDLVDKVGKVKLFVLSSAIKSMATAILEMAVALKIFSTMSLSELGIALGGLVGSLVSLGVFISQVDLGGLSKKAAAGLVPLAFSLVLIGAAVAIFGSIKFETLIQGLMGVAVAMGIMGRFISLVNSEHILAIGAGMTLLSIAMIGLVGAITLLGVIKWEWLLQGIIGMAAAVGLLGLALKLFDAGSLIAAAALTVAAVGILTLAAAITILGLVPLGNIAKALGTLVATLLIFGGLSILLSGLIVPMLTLSGTLIVMSLAIAALGAALTVLSVGLSAAVGVIVGAIKIILKALKSLYNGIVGVIGFIVGIFSKENGKKFTQNFSIGLKEGIDDNLDGLEQEAKKLGQAGTQGLSSTEKDYKKEGSVLGNEGVIGLASRSKSMISTGKDFSLAGLSGIEGTENLFNMEGVDLGDTFIDGFDLQSGLFNNSALSMGTGGANALGGLESLFNSTGQNLGGAVSKGFKLEEATFKEAARQLGDAGARELEAKLAKFEAAGESNAQGYANGMTKTNEIKRVQSKAEYLYLSGLVAAEEAGEINSPSKVWEWVGEMSAEGLILGLESYNNKVAEAGSDLSKNAYEGLVSPLNDVRTALTEDFDPTLTITPILDLSEIQNGVGMMNGLFSNPTLMPSYGYQNAMASMQNASLTERLTSLEGRLAELIMEERARNEINTAEAIASAINGLGVYLDKDRVGNIVSSQQANLRKARGV